MNRLALFLAAVALTACADTATSRPAAPPKARADAFCRSGYMVAYNQATGTYDSTYTGCVPGQQ